MRWLSMVVLAACGGASPAPEAPPAVAEVELGYGAELLPHDPDGERAPIAEVAIFDRSETREPIDPNAEILGDFEAHEGTYIITRAGPDLAEFGELTILNETGTCSARATRAVAVRIHYVYPDPEPPADDPSSIDRLAEMAFWEGCPGAVGVLRNAGEVSFRTLDYDTAVPAPPEIVALVGAPEPDENGETAALRMLALRAPETYVVTDDGSYGTIVHRGRALPGGDFVPYAEVSTDGRTFLLQDTVSSGDIAFELSTP